VPVVDTVCRIVAVVAATSEVVVADADDELERVVAQAAVPPPARRTTRPPATSHLRARHLRTDHKAGTGAFRQRDPGDVTEPVDSCSRL
jgi:hypothetical protein